MLGSVPLLFLGSAVADLASTAPKPSRWLCPTTQGSQTEKHCQVIRVKCHAESKSVMYAQADFSPSAFMISPLSMRFVADGICGNAARRIPLWKSN